VLSWQLSSGNAARFLSTIGPHLLVKALEAELALSWQRNRKTFSRDVRGRVAGIAVIPLDVVISNELKRLKAEIASIATCLPQNECVALLSELAERSASSADRQPRRRGDWTLRAA
jgi:hypothetical protein